MNYRGRGIYKHYKGKECRVLGLGKLETEGEQGKPYVIYEEEGMEECWLRPLHDFNAKVRRYGPQALSDEMVPRFEWVGPLNEDPPLYLVDEDTGVVATVDSATRQLAEDVMSIAETAVIPDSFYHTDKRLLRAQAILNGVSEED